ncbi:MAG: helix-turn-helix transcriptional regulator [Lachnospiraceae bacterium]|nr:helix-turn-helix transcriptional regulator [Lachnospiraceae bacterium]
MNVGERIKEIRTAKKLKQSDIAEEAGISRIAIGNYERGERQPTIEIAVRIAKALGVSISDLVSDNDYDSIRDSSAMEGLKFILKYVYNEALFEASYIEDSDGVREYDGDFTVTLKAEGKEPIYLSKQDYKTLFNFVCNNIPMFINMIEKQK